MLVDVARLLGVVHVQRLPQLFRREPPPASLRLDDRCIERRDGIAVGLVEKPSAIRRQLGPPQLQLVQKFGVRRTLATVCLVEVGLGRLQRRCEQHAALAIVARLSLRLHQEPTLTVADQNDHALVARLGHLQEHHLHPLDHLARSESDEHEDAAEEALVRATDVGVHTVLLLNAPTLFGLVAVMRRLVEGDDIHPHRACGTTLLQPFLPVFHELAPVFGLKRP